MSICPLAMYVRSISLLCAFLLVLCSYDASNAQTQQPGQVINIPPPAKPASAPIEFERINLGPNINSQYSELFPILTPDETVMYFVRKGDPQNTGYAKNHNDEDIWYSTRQSDGSWSVARKLEGPLNTENYD